MTLAGIEVKMNLKNEKTQAHKNSGWEFFCTSLSSARAATRQSGFNLAGLAEDSFFVALP